MTARDDLSRLTLERFVLGRLDASERADVERRVSEDPALEGRLATIQQQIEEAREDLPPLDLSIFSAPEAPHLEVVPTPKKGRSPWRWARLGVAALAAGTALVVVPNFGGPGETFRGSFDLEVQHIRGGNPSSVGVMVEARTGDRIQYTVTPARDGWLMVADLQDDGELSWWSPPKRVQANEVIGGAVVLDDYQGASERAFFIVSDQPMELDVLRAAYADAYRRPLVEIDQLPGLDADQRSILIVRETE